MGRRKKRSSPGPALSLSKGTRPRHEDGAPAAPSVAPAQHRATRLGGVALGLAIVAVSAFVLLNWFASTPSREKMGAAPPATPSSNSPAAPTNAFLKAYPRFDDFVGAEACAKCHAREYALWTNSTHGRAGGRPGEVPVIARFDGQPLRFSDAIVTPLTNRAGDYLFVIAEPDEAPTALKVEAVVGGGHMHGGGTQSFFTRHPDGTYRFLPFDFIRRENLWFVQMRRDLTWRPISPQISLNNDLANWPPRRVLGSASEFSNCQNCHGSQITLQYDAQAHSYQTRFQSLRVNCESCHGPGRHHTQLVSRPGWEKNPDLGLLALATQSKQQSVETCHQCHANKDSIRDDPYLPGAPLQDYFSLKLGMLTDNPFLPDGRVRRFSYQSNHEFSDCFLNGSMTCVDCHDPHAQEYRDVFGKPLAGRFDNRQCTGCHASKGLAAEAHSHHRADSAGNLCVSCHMPYLQHQGVGRHLAFARSDHSIPIPRPAFDQSLGIENACQKCHQDKELTWQQSHLDTWYGRTKPHPPLVAALTQTNAPASLRDAAVAFLAPEAQHPMAQTAGLARFIEQHLRPGQVDVDPEVLRRLRALADNPDMDVQAIALMALQVGYGEVAGVKETIGTRLNRLPEDGALRRRWAIASDQLGEAFGAKGDVASATACFEKALIVQPRNEVLLSHLALAQFRSGHSELAIDTLKRAIALRPAKAVLHFQLAQLFSQLQRLPEAAAALEAGLQYSPDDANARAMLQKLRGQ